MPNHVTNILTFDGSKEEIEALRNHIKSVDKDGDELAIDFNKIIPMPESLMITSGSMVDNGIAVIKFTEENDDTELKKMLQWPWVKSENITTVKQLVKYFLKKAEDNPGFLQEARVAVDNIKKYGFKDWYYWSIANWGTKWNAYSISADDNKIAFDTAWSSPMPVIEELSNMFPNVKITIEYADEDFGHNCGVIMFLAGDMIADDIPEGGTAEAYKIAAKIQGGEIDDLMCYICDSESEEFITTLLETVLELFGLKTFVYYVQTEEAEIFSETFLNTAKDMLVELEAYEHIGVLDEKLKLKVEEE